MEFDKKPLTTTEETNINQQQNTNIQSSQQQKEHVVLLLDESGSMSESFCTKAMFAGEKDKYIKKNEMLKKAVDKMLSVSDGALTEYTIIGFHSAVNILCERQSNMEALRENFKLLEGESTKMAEGITHAIEQNPDRIVLFTDGQPNPPKDAVIQAATTAKNLHIIIDTIGIGDADTILLEQIADITGGVYAYAHSEHDLEDIFQTLETQNYLQLEDHSIKL